MVDGPGHRARITGVIVPIRAFAHAKARLSAELDAEHRAILARRLADRVVGAAGPMPVVVVTGAGEVRAWAADRGLTVVDDPGSLDAAARAGRDHLRSIGCRRVIVAHADLPWATDLSALARDASQPVVALVPCHRDDGTPVLSVPAGLPFDFAYGPGSFRRHVAEARRRGYGIRVVRDAALAFDVDVPSDLAALDHDPRFGVVTPVDA
ncbi:MAG TPA: 2-phospho-L-lactate guanylyltransferase [Acidimicrobiia bacterium]|nr:2-phospho-L-lactate guanylyltransferase [Acidimicrobiia bacterium]